MLLLIWMRGPVYVLINLNIFLCYDLRDDCNDCVTLNVSLLDNLVLIVSIGFGTSEPGASPLVPADSAQPCLNSVQSVIFFDLYIL